VTISTRHINPTSYQEDEDVIQIKVQITLGSFQVWWRKISNPPDYPTPIHTAFMPTNSASPSRAIPLPPYSRL
jgi:hypothetical protein